MPVIAADVLLTDLAGYSNVYLSPDVGVSSMSPGAPPYAQSLIVPGLQVTLTPNFPVSSDAKRVIPCDYVRSYFDDFYNRIHVTPSSIDFGSIVASATRTITVWNAYLTAQVFSEMNAPSDIGMSITPPAGVSIPSAFAPLQQWTFNVICNLIGPPTFASEITFTISGKTFALPTTGTRLVVFPFPPDWGSPVDEGYEWNSWVLTAADGSEQTGSNWGNQPRRSFDYTAKIKKTSMQRFENMVFAWQDRTFGLPVWTDKSKTTALVSPGAVLVPCDTTLRSFAVGGFAVLYHDENNYEAFSVASVTSTSVGAALPIQKSWPVGTRILPLVPALLNTNMSGSYQSDNYLQAQLHFDCDPQGTAGNTNTTGSVPQYQGEELYLVRTNWASAVQFTSDSARKTVDYKTGAKATYSPQGFSKTTRKHTWNLRNRQEAADFRAFIGRRQGVAVPVYMPTGNTDFTLAAPILNGTSYMDVSLNDYDLFGGMNPARRDIIVILRNGTYFTRRITNAQLTGAVLRLTLDATFPQNVDPSAVKRVSLLAFYRLATNTLSIRWLTDSVGTVETNLVTKPTP